MATAPFRPRAPRSIEVDCSRLKSVEVGLAWTWGLILGILCISLAGCAGPARPGVHPTTPTLGDARTRQFGARNLRGYGSLEGTAWTFGNSSVLCIRCDGEQQAMLTQAKFLSDLTVLPGTEPGVVRIDDVEVPIVKAAQGMLAAGRNGRDVFLFAADSAEKMRTLLTEAFAADPATLSFTSETDVPMCLDCWDKYGFRFYYRPWETPKGTKWANYDVLEEFSFADKLGDLGFIFWAKPDEHDTGPGLTNKLWWDWAARAAERRELPIVINTVRAARTWFLNEYRDEVMAKMPQYCGSFHSIAEPHHDGMRQISWCAGEARDADYAILQEHVKEMSTWPNTIGYMEPNCELKHGEYDVFLEYGPAADASYREFLKTQYGSPARLSERWYGKVDTLASWNDVHVPELASFLGWGPEAIDLTGAWKIDYEPFADGVSYQPHQLSAMHHDDIPTTPAPDAWYARDFDDSKWPAIQAPGSDLMMFMPKRPAVLRRTFGVPVGWLKDNDRAWLYLWDLNYGKHKKSWVRAVLNDKEVGNDLLQHAKPHWTAFEVTDALSEGSNLLAVRVPKGVLAYRVYLSKKPPVQYPQLGKHVNAQWVDFSDWRRHIRLDTCRRGIEMIRQIDPNRSIILAAPDGYFTGIKQLCEDYGGRFHNTGHMGAFWNDYLPALMRGSDLPFSLEPGGPASDLPGFKKMMGRYFTEDIHAIHYFIHVGCIMWPDDIRTHFEQIQPLVNTIGKVHAPKAKVAALLSKRTDSLAGYPWGKDYNVNLPTGYWGWRMTDALGETFHVDAITDADFGTPTATAYPVVVDTNTSVMDSVTVDRIEQWVRDGGTFVTFIQTGRHTPEEPDRWPISRLTGYEVTGIDPHDAKKGDEHKVRDFTFAEGQTIFRPADWSSGRQRRANGLSLRRRAAECRDLLVWEDGSVAAGLRPLGKGVVVHLGLKFGSGRAGMGGDNRLMLQRVLEWAKVPRLGAQAEGVMLRHFVSNNGLYDVWSLWNRDANKIVTTRLVFDGAAPTPCHDVLAGTTIDPAADLIIPPLETRIYLTPRKDVADAPLDWFRLQRNWWRGTKKPADTKLPLPERKNAHVLTDDWAYRVLDEASKDDLTPLAAPDLDESSWPRRDLNCWAVGEELPSRHVFFRKSFTVPAEWQNGDLKLWFKSWFHYTVIGTAKYWLDGAPIPAGDGREGLIHPLDFAPGSTHCLAVEIRGEGTVCGVRGNVWLDFLPTPRQRLSLAGKWVPSPDLLNWQEPIDVPGRVDSAKAARRTFELPGDWADGQVYLYMRTDHGMTGAIVNGRYIRRHHHCLGDITFLNITPLLKRGESNEIQLPLPGGNGKRSIHDIELRLYQQTDL